MGKSHYQVHIAAVGVEHDGPITKVLTAFGGVDRLYLLYTDNEQPLRGGYIENRVRTEDEYGSTNVIQIGSQNLSDGCTPSNVSKEYVKSKSRLLAEKIESNYEHSFNSINLVRIPMFDFQGIVQTVFQIYKKERAPDVDFSVNITGGTNLMAAALCYVSYYINAKIYYAGNSNAPISEQVKPIDAPKAINLDKMHRTTKEFLKIIYKDSIANRSISVSDVLRQLDNGLTKQKATYHKEQLLKLGLIEETDYYETKNVNGSTVQKINKSKISLKVTMNGAMIASCLT